jgi:hypothetical protein
VVSPESSQLPVAGGGPDGGPLPPVQREEKLDLAHRAGSTEGCVSARRPAALARGRAARYAARSA